MSGDNGRRAPTEPEKLMAEISCLKFEVSRLVRQVATLMESHRLLREAYEKHVRITHAGWEYKGAWAATATAASPGKNVDRRKTRLPKNRAAAVDRSGD